MDAPVVFTEAQADTDDYLLDLDADPSAEDFDFKLDGVYDTGTVDTLIETSGEVGADAGPDLEIRGEDEETHAAVAKEEYSGANEEAQDGGVDASIEYQDEIGYEDDESAPPDAANTGTEETSAPHPEQSATNYEDVRDQQDVSGHQEGAYESEQGARDQNKELDAHDGSFQQEDAHDQDEEHGLQENDVRGTSALESTDASTHQSLLDHGRTPASNPDDFENADSDASDNSSMLLDIVVHYNQGQYALVGDPADDPDTYFFSDENVLTGPLSHFLASIRTVLSDEVSPGDELSIRVESLDFEFGEKSSKKFLDRPFYDIVKCFAGLAENSKLPSKDSSTLNLALMVRRDCEDHFCELLTEAGLAGHKGDEGVDDASSGDQAHDESSADEVPGGYDLDPEAAGAADEDEDDAERNEDEVEMYFAEAFEDLDDTMGDPFDLEMGAPGPTEQPGAEASDEQNTEAPRDEDPQEGHGGADDIGDEERAAAADGLGDDDVDFSADFEGEFAADPTKEESELAGDAPDQAVEAVNNDWYEEAGTGEDVGVEEVNAANPAGATTEQGLPQNVSDVDFGFTLDPESGLSTTLDEHGDVGTALEVDLGHASTNSSHLVANVSNGLGSASNHTSRTSTIIGDEVETQGSSLLHSAFSDVQHGTESQGDRDEIDWENDGEENEEQPQLAQTTNTPSAKRTRTNEPESLDEEADYKRRRT